jgi:crotonobetainyl-CoA:carnitine CoA-transferase CaiB-like acyl-CoA transferase
MNHEDIGTLKYPGPPYMFSKTQWSLERPAPRLGEHNEEIYCGRLGYSKKDLVKLRKDKII